MGDDFSSINYVIFFQGGGVGVNAHNPPFAYGPGCLTKLTHILKRATLISRTVGTRIYRYLYCSAKPKKRNSKKVNFTGERFLFFVNSISCDYHHYHKIRLSDQLFGVIFL